MSDESVSKGKIALSGLAVVALGFAGYRYAQSTPDFQEVLDSRPGLAERPDIPAPDRPPRGEGGRRGGFGVMAEELDLTDDQTAQMEALRGQEFASFDERREAMREVLTPAQRETWDAQQQEREQMMAQRMQQRLDEAQAALPPDQFEVFAERLEERRRERQGRGGPPGAGAPRPNGQVS